MKKRISLVLVAVLIISILGTAFVGAQTIESLPGGGWWAQYGVQNIGGEAATINAEFYHVTDGNTQIYEGTLADPLPSGASFNWLPVYDAAWTAFLESPELPDNFIGSVVLQADQPVAAIVQVGNNELAYSPDPVGVSGGNASAMYQGTGGTEASSTLLWPTVKNNFNGKTTTFFVQAVGGATTVDFVYNMMDGGVYTETKTVEANKTYVFEPTNAGVPSEQAPDGCDASSCNNIGAASITSQDGTQLAGAVVEYKDGEDPAQLAQATRLLTQNDAGNTIYAPTVKHFFNGRYAGITVMNAGDQAATFTAKTVIANPGDSTAQIGDEYSATSPSIEPGNAYTFHPMQSNMGGFPETALGAISVECTEEIVGVVNEANFLWAGGPDATEKATMYYAFPPSAGKTKVAFPQVKEFFGGNTTGVTVQNVAEEDAIIVADYVYGDESYTVNTDLTGGTEQLTLAQGASYTFWGVTASFQYQAGYTSHTGQNNAVTVRLTSQSGSLVGLAQEAATGGGLLDTKNYEGFGLD